MRLALPARPQFSLPAVARSHGWVMLAPFYEDSAAGGLHYIARLDAGRFVELQISEAPGGVNVAVVGYPMVDLRKRLLSIKGVGAYAAANLLMLLGRYDFIPVDSWAF